MVVPCRNRRHDPNKSIEGPFAGDHDFLGNDPELDDLAIKARGPGADGLFALDGRLARGIPDGVVVKKVEQIPDIAALESPVTQMVDESRSD